MKPEEIPRVVGKFLEGPLKFFPPIDLGADDGEEVEANFVMSGPHRWADIRVDGVPINGEALA